MPHLTLVASGLRAQSLRPVVDLEIVVPVLDEEGRIGPTLAALVAHLTLQPWTSAITVVDNGCSDRTLEIVDAFDSAAVNVSTIGCSRRGKGAAVRRALATTRARWAGFVDADLATPIEHIDEVVRHLQAGAPVVFGSRRCAGATYLEPQGRGRRLGGAAFRALARTVAPDVADTQCGFKFFHAEAARTLFGASRADGFAFDVEIVALAADAGLPVLEIPVQWRDCAGSSFRPVTDGTAALRELGTLKRRRRRVAVD